MPLGDAPEAGSRVVEAVVRGGQWEVVCSSSGVQQWTDLVADKVVAVGGSMHFAAVAFEAATLQVSFSLSGTAALAAVTVALSPLMRFRTHTSGMAFICVCHVVLVCQSCPILPCVPVVQQMKASSRQLYHAYSLVTATCCLEGSAHTKPVVTLCDIAILATRRLQALICVLS